MTAEIEVLAHIAAAARYMATVGRVTDLPLDLRRLRCASIGIEAAIGEFEAAQRKSRGEPALLAMLVEFQETINELEEARRMIEETRLLFEEAP